MSDTPIPPWDAGNQEPRQLAMKIAARMHDGECPSYYEKVQFTEGQIAPLFEQVAAKDAEIERLRESYAETVKEYSEAAATKDAEIERLRFGCALAEAQRDDALCELREARKAIREAVHATKYIDVTPPVRESLPCWGATRLPAFKELPAVQAALKEEDNG